MVYKKKCIYIHQTITCTKFRKLFNPFFVLSDRQSNLHKNERHKFTSFNFLSRVFAVVLFLQLINSSFISNPPALHNTRVGTSFNALNLYYAFSFYIILYMFDFVAYFVSKKKTMKKCGGMNMRLNYCITSKTMKSNFHCMAFKCG